MVPESFSTKLFSPKLLEARIMSSDSFSFVLLSPGKLFKQVFGKVLNVFVTRPILLVIH
jgi:hypothetical protein